MGWQRRGQIEVNLEDFDENESYTPAVLDAYADAFLRADARKVDEETGKSRGIGGENPILFEEHLYNRRRREIMTQSGIPDETLTQTLSRDGVMLYNRSHPLGRKTNDLKSRRESGAPYYK